MSIRQIKVNGAIDEQTRCKLYKQINDRIAIKFYCCGEYFSCWYCHEEHGCGSPKVWPKEKFNERGILCGECRKELTIAEYLQCHSNCPYCSTTFNPGCSLHYHYYFEVED